MLKKFIYTTMLVATVALSACSSDDEPAVLEGVTADGSSFMLNETGEVSLQFTVTPADAFISYVTLAGGTEAFEIGKLTSAGNGKWAVSLKAKDFAQIGAGNVVSLQVAQTDGIQKEVAFNVEDPYSIEDKFELNSPRAFDYYGIEPDHTYETGLPIQILAKEVGDLSLISDDGIKITNSTLSQAVSADYFVALPLTGDAVGKVLKVNPEKLDELKNIIHTYSPLSFWVVLTSKYGRITHLPLSFAACNPNGAPVEDAQLTVTLAELSNPDFKKTVNLDVTSKLRHLGLTSVSSPGAMIEEIGLFNDKGELMDESSIVPMYQESADGKMICDFSFFGDSETHLVPGAYTWVQRFHDSVTVGGVKYTTVCADLKFKVEIK